MGEVVGFLVIMVSFMAFWLTFDYILSRRGVPVWKRNMLMDIGIGLFDLANAVWSAWRGDVGSACFWGAITGWMFWCAWDNWRRNRKRRGLLGRWLGRKVVDIGGKLKVVDLGPKEAHV